ncbi:hypothetical protein [Hyphomicrobium sp. MC1]|uniref:hypothetical protein n=1 Tax=Hyphomicrobium sp. (strain MC1) TaxID=717785 RepID=UPI000213DAA4|nr:hypothetical protein [Hyphomicrobium sp. MC1]CCB64457.1 membrane protein of unknown function [Hyphomicrobium sp. MC1]
MENPSLWKLVTAIPRGLAFVIVGLGSFLATQWKQYTPFGQMLWVLALIAISVDAGIAYQFGSTLSVLHAAGFALVALAFCILPDVSAMEFRKGRKTTGGWIALACVPLGMVAFLTHLGYSASIRVGDFQQSDVHNAKYEDTRDAVKDAEGRIKQFSDRISELKAANPWITTVSADGLKAQEPALEEAIAQESRRGGCGPKCLALKQKLADVMEQAGKAEELASHEAMLVAAQRGLDKARASAHDATYVSSTAVNHTDTLFKAISFVRGQFTENVTMTDRDVTNTGIMGASSIAFLLLAPLFYLAAGLNRRPGVLDAWIHGKEEPQDIWQLQVKRNEAATAGGVLREEYTINDHRGVNELASRLTTNRDRALAILNGGAA